MNRSIFTEELTQEEFNKKKEQISSYLEGRKVIENRAIELIRQEQFDAAITILIKLD